MPRYEDDEIESLGADQYLAGIGGGALTGAVSGSTFGPIGTAVGGVGGALLGGLGVYQQNQQYKDSQLQQAELEAKLEDNSLYEGLIQQQGMREALARRQAETDISAAAARGNFTPESALGFQRQAITDRGIQSGIERASLYTAAQQMDQARRQQILQEEMVKQQLADATAPDNTFQQALGGAAQAAAMYGTIKGQVDPDIYKKAIPTEPTGTSAEFVGAMAAPWVTQDPAAHQRTMADPWGVGAPYIAAEAFTPPVAAPVAAPVPVAPAAPARAPVGPPAASGASRRPVAGAPVGPAVGVPGAVSAAPVAAPGGGVSTETVMAAAGGMDPGKLLDETLQKAMAPAATVAPAPPLPVGANQGIGAPGIENVVSRAAQGVGEAGWNVMTGDAPTWQQGLLNTLVVPPAGAATQYSTGIQSTAPPPTGVMSAPTRMVQPSSTVDLTMVGEEQLWALAQNKFPGQTSFKNYGGTTVPWSKLSREEQEGYASYGLE